MHSRIHGPPQSIKTGPGDHVAIGLGTAYSGPPRPVEGGTNYFTVTGHYTQVPLFNNFSPSQSAFKSQSLSVS